MTKNDNTENPRLTVRVLNADGEQVGLTYPKRAVGLVKKGRAQYVNGSDIRLTVSEVTEITEETKMDNNTTIINQSEAVNRLFFNARDWSFNPDCDNNIGNRSFMQAPDGTLAEAFMIGDWGYNWTEIKSKSFALPKNTLHTFTFWLNGGENDNNNEVCRFEIVFHDDYRVGLTDYERRFTYNLNRNFIKPIKKVNGWELYEIPFRTGDNEYTQLRFVAQRAYMTVLGAKGAEYYADLPDTADEFEEYRPQRHNIVFNDGWPTNTWYSTRELKKKYGSPASDSAKPQEMFAEFKRPKEYRAAYIASLERKISEINDFLSRMVDEQIRGEVFNAVEDAISSADSAEDINPDDIAEAVSDSILEELGDKIEDIVEGLSDAVEEITDAIEELQETIEDSQDND
ncbi:MAG: hypothetical protein ACI4KM_09280 [Oscillospiraceae bacterium]